MKKFINRKYLLNMIILNMMNGNLLCYLFLKNGMFINNYLVKKGLADIDEKYNFIYKTKFQNLKNKISNK